MATILDLGPVHSGPGASPAPMMPKTKAQLVFEQFFNSPSKSAASATTTAAPIGSAAIALGFSSHAVGEVGAATDVMDVSMDAAFGGRTLLETLPQYSTYPSSQAMDAGAGVPTGLNTITGAIAIHAARKRNQEAHRSGDQVGVTESRIDLARGVTQTATGVTYVGIRATTIATTISPQVSILASVAAILSAIGGIILLPLYALFGALGYVRKKECDEFAAKFEELATPQEKLQFLIDSIYGSAAELAAIKPVDRVLILELLHQKFPDLKSGGITELEKLLSLPERDGGLSPADQKELLTLILNTAFPELVELKQLYATHLQGKELTDQLGRLIHLQKMQKRKIAHLSRVIGGDAVAKIQRAAQRGLQPRAETEAGRIEVTSLIEEVTAAQAKISHTFKILKWIGLIGTLMSIPSALAALGHLLVGVAFLALFANPYVLLAGLILLVILIGLMLYLDVGGLRSSLDKQPGTHDKTILWTSLTVVLLGLAGIITVAVLLPFSPWILAISLAISVGIALYYIGMLHAVSRAQRKWDLAHPQTGEDFDEAVKSKGSTVDATTKVFKTLPKAVRQIVTAKLLKEEFVTDHYKELNEHGQFGCKYLEKYLREESINGEPINKIEIARIERAVKKATKSLWTNWWRAEAHEKATIEQQALAVDKLLQLLKKKQIAEALTHYEKLDDAMKTSIHYHVWSIFIREEDSDRLDSAVKEVLNQLKAS